MKVAIALLIGMTASVAAQEFPMSMSLSNNTQFTADWDKVTECANKPYPKVVMADARARELAAAYYHNISACRWALAERHAVWIEAGRSPESNKYPPVSVYNAEDFKRDLICDYSVLDKNGMGTIHCNVDKW